MMQPIRLDGDSSVLSNNHGTSAHEYRSQQQEHYVRGSASSDIGRQKIFMGGPSGNFDRNQSKLYQAVKLQQIQQSR